MLTLPKSWMTLFSVILMLAAMLAGCGPGSNTAATEQENSPSSASPSASAPAASKGPAKIVVTYFPYADHLFALGKADAVAGVVNLKSLRDFTVYDPFLKDGRIADLGDQANFEKIVALNPDLIIASQADAPNLDQLSKIAKTVTVNATLNWQETIRGVAAAVGEEAQAEQYISQFLKKQAEASAAIEQSGEKGKSALFLMPWKKSFTYWSGSRMSLYYEKLGFRPFDGMSNVGEITIEGISKLDPEYIFIGKDYTNSSEITLKDLETNPVWNSLSAVKNKKMFVVDTEILGPLAMGQFKGLTYMQELFTGGKAK